MIGIIFPSVKRFPPRFIPYPFWVLTPAPILQTDKDRLSDLPVAALRSDPGARAGLAPNSGL